ncbi:MAG TPA: hypothetical protein DDZ88_04780 [Verrucomicrobiales bacterium]|nr:hypothetical protein [Verrucomicrobiales bacterium]
MSTIALNPFELKSLIQEAVNEAFHQNLSTMADYMEEEAVVDRNLARLLDEARDRNEPTLTLEEFRQRLQADIDAS